MKYFKDLDNEQLKYSFDFIENFVNTHIKDGKVKPDTDAVVLLFRNAIQKFSKEDFAFLLLHSGYIPDYYAADSSEETLYSKLIEAIVCEWSIRIGFNKSYLQKVKSNKEDVTIVRRNDVIVCDAKSFRLGRSQQAPNVKDVIKKAAYITWLECYDNMNQIGGIVTFPSLHKHKKATEVYQYFTEGNPSIMMLTYEDMSYMLLRNYTADDIIHFLKNYNEIFPVPSTDITVYTEGINKYLFSKISVIDYLEFIDESKKIINLKIQHVLDNLNDKMAKAKEQINDEIMHKSFEDLRKFAIETKYQHECQDIIDKEKNIRKFRHP